MQGVIYTDKDGMVILDKIKYFWQMLKCSWGYHKWISGPEYVFELEFIPGYKESTRSYCIHCGEVSDCVVSHFEGKFTAGSK